MTLFADFLLYCTDENEELTKEIKTYLADYFDLPNRTIEVLVKIIDWQ